MQIRRRPVRRRAVRIGQEAVVDPRSAGLVVPRQNGRHGGLPPGKAWVEPLGHLQLAGVGKGVPPRKRLLELSGLIDEVPSHDVTVRS